MAPEFVAEVVSPNDTSSDVEQKALAWMEAGVTIVLVVDPQTKSVRQYKSAEEIVVSTRGVIEFGQILTGFRLDVEELFIP